MRSILSRWFLFGLLIGWSLSHATVFGQPADKKSDAGNVANAADKIRQALDKVITVDYTAQTLTEVLNHFRDKTGLTITIDQGAFMQFGMDPNVPIGQVEMKGKDQKASVILRKLLDGYRLSYVIFEDSLLITTEELALIRQMRQRVSVKVEDVPFKKAAGELARKQGINLVIDPLIKQTADMPLSLQLDNTGVETALRLLAEMVSLKAVRMGNVMFVTTPEKAKTILEEEKHHLDNPLNPNGVVNAPPIMVNGFGGRFGGGGFGGAGVFTPPGIPQIAPAQPPGIDPALPPLPRPDNAPPVKKGVIRPDGTAPPTPPLPPRLIFPRVPDAPPPATDPSSR